MRVRRTGRIVAAVAVAAALGAGVLTQGAGAASGTDPLAARQWGLAAVNARQAWALSRGAGAVIGIVDTGVDLGHPDLAGKLLPGATFLGCGAQSCGDGDWRSGPAARLKSVSPHGTHVAGIAAAGADNGVGIAGVAPDAKILPVKVLDDQGADLDDVARGIRWAVDHGAQVINLSLGAQPGAQLLGLLGGASAIDASLTYAKAKGVLVVGAAGNETFPLCATPAFDPGVMCVAATDRRGLPSIFSNLPVRPDLIGVSAPGGSLLFGGCDESIVSDVGRGANAQRACGLSEDYAAYAGTSMASPHVAGIAALLAAQGRSRDNIVRAITSTARTPILGLRGIYTPVWGYGIVDAAAAVASPKG